VLTVLSFLFALTLLIAVHEYGHYRVAVAWGVPVSVFSIGFGKTIYSWRPRNQRAGQNTELSHWGFATGRICTNAGQSGRNGSS